MVRPVLFPLVIEQNLQGLNFHAKTQRQASVET